MSGSLTVKKLKLDLTKIGKRSVYVGYPEGPNHQDSKVTNAELAFLMTSGVYMISKGDPVQRIPPRPFVEPAIERELPKIEAILKSSLSYSLDGREDLAEQERIKAGIVGENAIRKFIRDYPANKLTPNAPSTIRRKGEDHPLKGLTGELMRAATSVIRDD